jgi:WD40 repeat protein
MRILTSGVRLRTYSWSGTWLVASAIAAGLAPGASAEQTAASSTSSAAVQDYAKAMTAALDAVRKGEAGEAARLLAGTAEELRGWEFDYLSGLADGNVPQGSSTRTPGLIRPKIQGEYNFVLADPIRNRAALPFSDGTLRVVDLSELASPTPKVTTMFSAGPVLIMGAFSADGSTYAVGAEDGRVFVWQADGAAEAWSLPVGDKPVVFVALNRSGTRLIAETERGQVTLWDVASRGRVAVLGESFRYGRPVCFSPDGELIALGGTEHIEILAGDSGEKRREIEHAHYVMNLAFSADGKTIASGTRGSLAKSVALFDVATGRRIVECAGHTNGITGVAFNRQGTRLVSASGDGTLRFWHLPSGAELLRLEVGAPFGDAHFSADGRTLLWSASRGLEAIQIKR